MLKIPKPLPIPHDPTRENWMIHRLAELQHELENMINNTPTSSRRNELSDANIFLMHSIDKLRNLPTVDSIPRTAGI